MCAKTEPISESSWLHFVVLEILSMILEIYKFGQLSHCHMLHTFAEAFLLIALLISYLISRRVHLFYCGIKQRMVPEEILDCLKGMVPKKLT